MDQGIYGSRDQRFKGFCKALTDRLDRLFKKYQQTENKIKPSYKLEIGAFV